MKISLEEIKDIVTANNDTLDPEVMKSFYLRICEINKSAFDSIEWTANGHVVELTEKYKKILSVTSTSNFASAIMILVSLETTL